MAVDQHHERRREVPGRPNRTPSGDPTRVPPHDTDAESAALGAALLNTDAADSLIARLDPADFYVPAHRWIYGAIRDVRSQGRPVDTVTVAASLRNAGTLDDAGGPARLHDLIVDTPSISNVDQYATIVRDAAVLRRLLYAAADITETAYTNPDPGAAIAHAQDTLLNLATTGPDTANASTLDVADLAALLASDLEPEQPEILRRSDGTPLIYLGKMHVLQAEPSSGKTWIALAAALEVIAAGGAVVYLDYEDTPVGITRRLLALGADPTAIVDRVRYIRPVAAHGPAERLQLDRILDDVNPDLVIIDGVGESLTRNGFSENEAVDVLAWTDLLPRSFTARGCAVLMIDHVRKDPEGRGRWARGSGAKLGVVDGASYQVKLVSSFSRDRAGAVKLVIAKDRPGGVGAIGETAAIVKVEPAARGELVRVTLEPDGTRITSGDPWKPTHIMERVSREVEDSEIPLTAARVRDLVHSEPRLVSEAITRLVAEGYLSEEGPKTARTLRSVRRFRAAYADDTAEPPPDPEPDPSLLDDLEEPADHAADHAAYLDQLITREDPT